VARREAHDAADSWLCLGDQETFVLYVETLRTSVRLQRREVVFENKCRWIIRVSNAAGADVSGAEVAVGVICRLEILRQLRDLPLPGARGAVRGDQYPFVGQRVAPAMGIFFQFQSHERMMVTCHLRNFCEECDCSKTLEWSRVSTRGDWLTRWTGGEGDPSLRLKSGYAQDDTVALGRMS